jgi:hypothetical protein
LLLLFSRCVSGDGYQRAMSVETIEANLGWAISIGLAICSCYQLLEAALSQHIMHRKIMVFFHELQSNLLRRDS